MTKPNAYLAKRRIVDERIQKIAKDSFEPWSQRYMNWDDRVI